MNTSRKWVQSQSNFSSPAKPTEGLLHSVDLEAAVVDFGVFSSAPNNFELKLERKPIIPYRQGVAETGRSSRGEIF